MLPDPQQLLPVPTVAGSRERSWVTFEHPEYTASKGKWAFARDHYTGEVLDPALVPTYLIKRSKGETEESYVERCKLADYTNHFAEAVESLVGMLTAVEANANRAFNPEGGKGLGEPTEPDTPIGRLYRSADADGNGYLTVWKQLALELAVTHIAWLMVDTVRGGPVIRVFSALSVSNWKDDGTEVMLRESVDERASLRDPAATRDQYVHMTLAGWQRYRIDASTGREVAVGPPGTWHYETADGVRALPIFPVRLPMRRSVGYLLAKKCNAIFNKESERDNLLRVANFPRLVLSASNTLFESIVNSLTEGGTVIQEDPTEAGGHRFITPPTDAATAASEVLKQKVAEFQKVAHKAYDDGTGAQRTATEVRQDVASGTGAFLQLLKSALDDAENGALWRIEQTLFPSERRKWHVAHVERSDDFMPADADAYTEKSVALAFGKDASVPFGVTGMVAAALEAAKQRGLEVDEDELRAAVEVRAILDTMTTAATAGLELPALVRVELLMRLLAANGLVDAEAVTAMEDGSERKLLEVVREQVLAAAQAADEAKARESEALTKGAGTEPPAPAAKAGPKRTTIEYGENGKPSALLTD